MDAVCVQRAVTLSRQWTRTASKAAERVKGYRSTINSVLPLNGMDLANSKELSVPFRGFAGSYLNLLWEPTRNAEERFLAHETLFLIALASAKRVAELYALSCRVSHSMGWRRVSFSFVPGSVSKTQDQFPRPAVQELHDTDSTPVEQLSQRENPVSGTNRQMYLNRISHHHPRGKRLFVNSGHTRKETSKNTVSFCPVG